MAAKGREDIGFEGSERWRLLLSLTTGKATPKGNCRAEAKARLIARAGGHASVRTRALRSSSSCAPPSVVERD